MTSQYFYLKNKLSNMCRLQFLLIFLMLHSFLWWYKSKFLQNWIFLFFVISQQNMKFWLHIVLLIDVMFIIIVTLLNEEIECHWTELKKQLQLAKIKYHLNVNSNQKYMNLNVYIMSLLASMSLQIYHDLSFEKLWLINHLSETCIYYMINFKFCSHTWFIKLLIYFLKMYHIETIMYTTKKCEKKWWVRNSFIDI